MFRKYLVVPLVACLASLAAGATLAHEDGSTGVGGQVFLDFGHFNQQQGQADGTQKDVEVGLYAQYLL